MSTSHLTQQFSEHNERIPKIIRGQLVFYLYFFSSN